MTSTSIAAAFCTMCGTSSLQVRNLFPNLQKYPLLSDGPDLDFRPRSEDRRRLEGLIAECPDCGYCAPELETALPLAESTMNSSAYRELFESTPTSRVKSTLAKLFDRLRLREPIVVRIPQSARRFLAFALLNDSSNLEEAFQARLRAAWICDDHGAAYGAEHCRSLAIDTASRMMPHPDTEQGVTIGAIHVDLLRRTQDFSRAKSECRRVLALSHARGHFRMMLEYQLTLIAIKDSSVHSLVKLVDDESDERIGLAVRFPHKDLMSLMNSYSEGPGRHASATVITMRRGISNRPRGCERNAPGKVLFADFRRRSKPEAARCREESCSH